MGVTDRLLAQIAVLKAEKERLKKEADWLARKLEYYNTPHECEMSASEKVSAFGAPCFKPLKEQNCVECWREAARKAIADKEANDAA